MNDIRKILESIENIDHEEIDIWQQYLNYAKYIKTPSHKHKHLITDIGSNIYDAINDYIRYTNSTGSRDSEGERRKNVLYPILKSLMKLKHLYPNDLMPSTDSKGYVYRGRNLTVITYNRIVKKLIELDEQADTNGEMWIPFVYKPYYKLQSWSDNKGLAMQFSAFKYSDTPISKKNVDEKRKLSSIIRVKPDDSFIFNGSFIYEMRGESEVMRASKVPLQCEILLHRYKS